MKYLLFNIIFLFVLGYSQTSDFRDTGFKRFIFLWDMNISETPLEVYKRALTQLYPLNFNPKVVKKYNIEKCNIITIKRDTLTKKILLDTSNISFSVSIYEPSEIFYFDTLGRIIKKEVYELCFDEIQKKIYKYSYRNDTILINYVCYHWFLNKNYFTTSIEKQDFYKFALKNEEDNETYINLGLNGLVVIDTNLLLQIPDNNIKLIEDTLEITTNEFNLDKIYFYRTDLLVIFKNKLVQTIKIKYYILDSNKLIKTYFYYDQKKSLKKIIENEYKYNTTTRIDTLVLYGDMFKSKNFKLYLNKELIFERKFGADYILEQNFETGELRYIKMQYHMPIYEISLKKGDNANEYIFIEKVFRYKSKGNDIDW